MPDYKTANRENAQRDIVVIGSSAGGIKALLELVKHLPSDFPAPIFIVQHIAPHSESILPELINLRSPLKAKHPENGESIEAGTIYVAPPDHHLLLEEGKVVITRGPKENRFRPSVDALFRSAAYVYGPRVIGVVLSGYLDDGTSGLWSVQRLGGEAVVQDPQDAAYPDMPANALEFVEPDHIVPIAELAALLVRLTVEKAPTPPEVSEDVMKRLKLEITIARQDNAFEMGIIGEGELTPFTCPDCHGALTKLIEGDLIRFRCHTGHAFTVSTLLAQLTESVEDILYQAMRGLEETTMLLHNLGDHFKKTDQQEVADLFFRKADETGGRAQAVHDTIFKHEKLSADIRFQKKKLK